MTQPATQRDHAALPQIGHWTGPEDSATFALLGDDVVRRSMRSTVYVLADPSTGARGIAVDGHFTTAPADAGSAWPVLATLPPTYPEWLGDRSFHQAHGVRFAYVGGAMARGIASVDLVLEIARLGGLGMFGAAGLSLEVIEAAIDRLSAELDPQGLPWGSNLIHSPNEPGMEAAVVDLYLRRGVRRVSASAFMGLTPAVVRYACSGLRRAADGGIVRQNYLFAKISREEVARHFLAPAPAAILADLVAAGQLTAEEAALAAEVPLAEDIIVESDSGGHTDNRPLGALFPAIQLLAGRLAAEHGYSRPLRLGAAGGLGTPASVAAAYGLGAAFVVVGTVHQACIESGVSHQSREMLAAAGIADVMMTASADMFELGVKVQVLKRGTMMPVRGNQLYDLYTRYNSIDEIPADERAKIESTIFRTSLEDVWEQTVAFFSRVEPAQLERAQANPKLKMALIFRWYVGQSSRWPIVGDDDRRSDYQLWCGPAMGAFNSWVSGSFLEPAGNRTVRQVALNLLEGAAVTSRASQLRSFGVPLGNPSFQFRPLQLQ